MACERASGDFDARHVVNANVVYDLPFGPEKAFLSQPGIARAILGRWSVTDIVAARSGTPLNVAYSRSSSSVATGYTTNQRPNLVPGVSIVPPGGKSIRGTIMNWINPAAFTAVPGPGYGDTPRNIARGPNLWQTDLGVSTSSFHSTNAPNSNSGARHSISLIAPSTACRSRKSGCRLPKHRPPPLSRRCPQQARLRLVLELRARFNSHCGWNFKCMSVPRGLSVYKLDREYQKGKVYATYLFGLAVSNRLRPDSNNCAGSASDTLTINAAMSPPEVVSDDEIMTVPGNKSFPIGRWCDAHSESSARPDPVMYIIDNK